MIGGDAPAPALDDSLLRLVRIEAALVTRALPRDVVVFDDLLAYGHLGLLEARARFDPCRGVQFDTYARYRVRGAIYDGLRSLGVFSRRAYEDLRRQSIAHEVIGEPTPDPPPGGTEEARAADAAAVVGDITALATAFLVQAAVEEPAAADPEVATGRTRDLGRMRAALERLDAESRALLTAVYDLEHTGDSAVALAGRLRVHPSTVSRRHQRALRRLRRLMLGFPP